MEKSETQENTTMINNKRNNATTLSSLPTPNSSPTNPNTEDEEPKPKIQRKCCIIKSPNYNLKITFAKPPSSQQQPFLNNNNNNKQPEASKVEFKPPVIMSNNKPKMMKIKKPNNNKSGKLSFVDHDGSIKASIIEHVRHNFGYNEVSDVKIIMEKKMTPTDVAPKQARLALPAGSAEKLDASFLRNDEKELLKKADINVKVIMGLSVYEMPLGKWNYFVDKEKKKKKNNNNNNNNNEDPGFKYVLKSGLRHQWPKLKEENGLQTDDYILLATFRYNNALHFVIIKAKPVMVFGATIGRTYSFED